MARRLVKSILLATLLLAAATPGYAETEPTPETIIAAEKNGLDPVALQGAVNESGHDPDTYLCLVGEGKCPVKTRTASVRLTYYVLRGTTANGESVHLGGTACSTNWSFGTLFRLPDGSVVRCNDRGILGKTGWLDVWGRPDLSRYGSNVTVEILDAYP